MAPGEEQFSSGVLGASSDGPGASSELHCCWFDGAGGPEVTVIVQYNVITSIFKVSID